MSGEKKGPENNDESIGRSVAMIELHVAYAIWSPTSLFVSLVFGSSEAFACSSMLIISFPLPLVTLSLIIPFENLRMKLVYWKNLRYSRVGKYLTRLSIGCGI